MPTDLSEAVAVVTGPCGRLGGIWVRTLLEAGADVVGLDLTDDTPRAVKQHRGPGRYLGLSGDVTDRATLRAALAETLAWSGTPSVLVNNAGIDQPPSASAAGRLFEDVPDGISDAVLDVNGLGVLRTCQVFGSAMARAGVGSIVNIGSLYGKVSPDQRFYDHLALDPPFLKPAAYGMSKAAVSALTRYLATLWGPDGVRVNTLSPGGVLGDQDPQFRRKFTARVPMRRMATEDDLSGPLLFLASDMSRYVTGCELFVDGGYVAW